MAEALTPPFEAERTATVAKNVGQPIQDEPKADHKDLRNAVMPIQNMEALLELEPSIRKRQHNVDAHATTVRAANRTNVELSKSLLREETPPSRLPTARPRKLMTLTMRMFLLLLVSVRSVCSQTIARVTPLAPARSARAFLLLAGLCVTRAHNGYAVSLEGLTQVLSLATPPLDMSNADTAKMSDGLSVMAWIRYRDVTVGRAQVEFSLLLSDDANFWNGLCVCTDRYEQMSWAAGRSRERERPVLKHPSRARLACGQWWARQSVDLCVRRPLDRHVRPCQP
jgi:hypothetical protein